jgi:DNA-binding GntR family transcriptional regulator
MIYRYLFDILRKTIILVVMTSDNIMKNDMRTIRSARSRRTTLTEAAHQELRQAVIKGIYPPGSQLPTEAELGELLGVSRTVVREALRALEEGGLIARRHGVGTFVRNRPILKHLNFNFGITEMIEAAGLTPGTSYLKIHHHKVDGDQQVVEQLNLPPDASLITIERVRTADEKPVVYSLDTFPEALLAGASLESSRLYSESLYQILQTEFGQVIDYGVAQVLPAKTPPHVAEKLALPKNSLVLYLIQVDYSLDDKPILFSREYHLPSAFDFMIWRRGPTSLRTAPPTPVPLISSQAIHG